MSAISFIPDPNDVRRCFSSKDSLPIEGKKEVEEFDESYIIKHDGIETQYHQFLGPIPHANEFIQTFLNFPEHLRGSYLRIRDQYGNTILHNLAREGQGEVIHRLFAALPNQNEIVECLRVQDYQSDTPLHKAVRWGNKKTASTMILAIKNSGFIDHCLLGIVNKKREIVMNTAILHGWDYSDSMYKMMQHFLDEENELKKDYFLRTLYS